MPEHTVYVGRPTRWGNPFYAVDDRVHSVRLFSNYINHPEQADLVWAIKNELRGKNLACWCSLDATCHADVLLRIANEVAS